VVARAARVLAVDAAPSASDTTGGSADGRVGVVVLVTAVEASHLADAIASGALMLALDPPSDACAAGSAADASPVSCRP
jgi:hypothetical protein